LDLTTSKFLREKAIMAPAQVSSQQLIAQAVQKLSDAMGTVSEPPNDFAATLLELLEVSAKINQFDEMNALAADEASSEEAQKWREISMMTMKHCQAQLSEQQQRLIAKLQGLSQSGASLVKAATIEPAMKPEPKVLKPAAPQVKPAAPQVKPQAKAVKPPPGLSTTAPPGLSGPPGLAPPPGLRSAGTARKAAGPEDVEYTSVKKQAPWNLKKQAAAPVQVPAPVKKEAEDGWTVKKGSPRKANPSKQAASAAPAVPASSVFLNFDAYDSD
jgi:hypothetical protein